MNFFLKIFRKKLFLCLLKKNRPVLMCRNSPSIKNHVFCGPMILVGYRRIMASQSIYFCTFLSFYQKGAVPTSPFLSVPNTIRWDTLLNKRKLSLLLFLNIYGKKQTHKYSFIYQYNSWVQKNAKIW